MKEFCEYFIAADSGGTKTDWLVFDRSGKILLTHRSSGLAMVNSGLLDYNLFVEENVVLQPFAPRAVFLSLGGPNINEVTEFLQKFFPNCRVEVEREANGNMILFAAAYFKCNAAVMIGTGSTAMGRIDGKIVYAGGWGPAYGDDGAGGGIGFRALRHYLRSLDGMESPGELNQIFQHLFDGLDIKTFAGRMELKARALKMNRRDLAQLVPALYDLSENGDEVTSALFDNAAYENAKLAAAVTPEKGAGAILGCGGFFKQGVKFRERCEYYLHLLRPEQQWVWQLDFSPVKAAMIYLQHRERLKINWKLLKENHE